MSEIPYPTSARAKARARAGARVRAGILDVGYRYRMSDMDIGRRIFILDVRSSSSPWSMFIIYHVFVVLNGAVYLRAFSINVASSEDQICVN